MKTQQDYRQFAKLAMYAEKALVKRGTAGSLYLFDENVDAENCTQHVYGSDEFWNSMYYAANNSVGMRADELKILDELYKIIPDLIY